jgi:UDP-3-O-acyl-N-acetylglucosamine deacetylase
VVECLSDRTTLSLLDSVQNRSEQMNFQFREIEHLKSLLQDHDGWDKLIVEVNSPTLPIMSHTGMRYSGFI